MPRVLDVYRRIDPDAFSDLSTKGSQEYDLQTTGRVPGVLEEEDIGKAPK